MRDNRARGKRRTGKPGISQLVPVSEEMKVFSAALAKEMEDWARIRTKPMFGFDSFYRGKVIFAALPKTRAWKTPNSLMFKISSPDAPLRSRLEADPRIDTSESGAWFPFEVRTESDLRAALKWLTLAYERATTK